MLSGTNSVTVNVSGPGALANGATQGTLAYNGFAASAGNTNTSASFNVQSQQGVTGPITISASASGLTSATATIQSVIAGNPSQMSASLSANSFAEGSPGITLNLQAEDAQGAPVAYPNNVMVTVTKSGSTTPASNILVNGSADTSTTEVTPNSSGSAAVTLTDSGVGANAGTYTVTIAPVTGATYSFPTQTLTFTETATTASKVSFSPGPVSVSIGSPSAQYTLQLVDKYGNPVDTSGVNLNVYASSSNGGAATVNGMAATSSTNPAVVTTNSQGQATVKLVATQPVQGATWTLTASGPSASSIGMSMSDGMTIANQIAGSLSVSTSPSTYATAGGNVTATVTVNDQYGGALANHRVNLAISVPQGLSGGSSAPSAVYGTSSTQGIVPTTWTQGQAQTITFNGVTSNTGKVTITGLKAWTEGQATLSVTANNVTANVSGTAQLYVQPGQAKQAGLFYNGSPVSNLAVTANTPVALTVEPEDVAGNPVAAAYAEAISLSGAGGFFLPSQTGAPITSVQLAAGQSSGTVYYVNGTSGSYTPTVQNILSVYSATNSVSSGGSTTVTAVYTNGTGVGVPNQSATASVTSGGGTLVSTSATTNASGNATFTYTAPSSGSGQADVKVTVGGLSQTIQINY